jgi:hypothetical protein
VTIAATDRLFVLQPKWRLHLFHVQPNLPVPSLVCGSRNHRAWEVGNVHVISRKCCRKSFGASLSGAQHGSGSPGRIGFGYS